MTLHHAVWAIYQNMIDYNTCSGFNLPVPGLAVLQKLYRIHDIDRKLLSRTFSNITARG